MNDKNTYSGDRTKNHFTAYVLEFIKGRRGRYLDKKIRSEKNAFLLEEIAEIEERITFDEMREKEEREQLLTKEMGGVFPGWGELSDQRLVKSLLMLSESEREIIYLHVFEERSFAEVGEMKGLKEQRCKDIYFYALRKIRKSMEVR